jgi:putative endonuclease
MAYYVYLLASKKHGTLYLGVTNDIVRRVHVHRTDAVKGFTSRYGVHKLVWFEIYDDALTAIAREKELKKWRRDWKIRLIEDSGLAPHGAPRNDEQRVPRTPPAPHSDLSMFQNTGVAGPSRTPESDFRHAPTPRHCPSGT